VMNKSHFEGNCGERNAVIAREARTKQSVDELLRKVELNRPALRINRLLHFVPPLSLWYFVRNDGNSPPALRTNGLLQCVPSLSLWYSFRNDGYSSLIINPLSLSFPPPALQPLGTIHIPVHELSSRYNPQKRAMD